MHFASEYVHALAHYWWVLGIGVFSAINNFWKFFHPSGKGLEVPLWFRVCWAVAAITAAQILVYRDSIHNLNQVITDKQSVVSENWQLKHPLKTRDAAQDKSAVNVKRQSVSHTIATVKQTGDKNISQIGNDNQATINPDVDPNKPVVTYEFRGIKHTVSPGRFGADDGEAGVFNEMSAKGQSQNWKALATQAEETKSNAPEWLTPYFMAGYAYENLCDTQKAIKNLSDFVQKAAGVPTFENAVQAAQLNLNNLKNGNILPQCKVPSPTSLINKHGPTA
jgi:hypothetical protein